MVIRIDPSRAAHANMNAYVPAGVAAKAASAGNTYLLEEFIVISLLRKALKESGDEETARAAVAGILKTYAVEVEFHG